MELGTGGDSALASSAHELSAGDVNCDSQHDALPGHVRQVSPPLECTDVAPADVLDESPAKPQIDTESCDPESDVEAAKSEEMGRRQSKTSSVSQAVKNAIVAKVPKVNPLRFTVMSAGGMLACCAGMVNVISFYALGSFTSHVTGTWTRVGMHAEGGAFQDACNAALIVLSFVLGATFCGCLIAKSTVQFGYSLYGFALMSNACLLVIAVVASETSAAKYLVAAACGLQNGMATSYSGAVIRTTHVTGLATDVGLILGRSIMALVRRRLRPGSATIADPAEESRKLILLLMLAVSFVVGVIIGALLHASLGVNALLVPAAIIGVAGMCYTVYRVSCLGRPLFDPDAWVASPRASGLITRLAVLSPKTRQRHSAWSEPEASSSSSSGPGQKHQERSEPPRLTSIGELTAASSFAQPLPPKTSSRLAKDILTTLDSLEAPIANISPGDVGEEAREAHRRLRELVSDISRAGGEAAVGGRKPTLD